MDNSQIPSPVSEIPSPEFKYAGFWKRIAAALLDVLLVWCVTLVLSIVSGMILRVSAGDSEAYSYHFFQIFYPILFFLYLIFLESSDRQATLGKRLLGIKVTDLAGNKLSLKQSFYRSIGKYILLIVFSPAFILTAFNKKKQSPYDKFTRTLVINK